MPVLQKGCCCVELETWAVIVGWFGAILSILDIIGSLTMHIPLEDKIVYSIIGLAHLIVSGLLIKATKDRKCNLVTPWLIASIIELIVTIILEVIQLVVASAPMETVASAVLLLCIAGALWLYFWLCIYSYYQQLSNQ